MSETKGTANVIPNSNEQTAMRREAIIRAARIAVNCYRWQGEGRAHYLADAMEKLGEVVDKFEAQSSKSCVSAGEGPTGCADDGDDLGIALTRLGRKGVNKVLRESLGTPNPLYVDEFGNG